MYAATTSHRVRIAALVREHPYEVLVRRSLITALCVLFAAYAMFVSASVLNVIARKEATSNAIATAANIASLEQEYFALSAQVLPEKGAEMGLVAVADKRFVTRAVHLGLSGAAQPLPRDNEN